MNPDGFTIAYPDASLKVTFISPTPLHIAEAKGINANKLSEISDPKDQAIQVTAEDPHEGEFFAVMTLQAGSPPQVHADKSGRAATVGGRSLRVKDTGIVLDP